MGLHEDAVVVDCHNDLILTVASRRAIGRDAFAEYWIPELRRGGVDVQVVPLFIEGEYAPDGALRRTLRLIELLYESVETHADDLALCRTGSEIDGALATGRIALVLALEGCAQLGTDVELFRTMYRLGVRMASFVHFGRTMLADGSAEEDAGGRLTRAGVAAVREMERLGMIVDVSHLSAAGTEHVLEIATRPVIASHSSARALCDHHRNLTDEQLKAIAATGGVIGVNVYAGFVDREDPTLERVVDHVEHMVSVAGADHVGLGPDFLTEYVAERYAAYPHVEIEGLDVRRTIAGIDRAADLPNLTEAMLGRGLPEDTVRKVLGESFLRVFRALLV